jgi:hypothetical protein
MSTATGNPSGRPDRRSDWVRQKHSQQPADAKLAGWADRIVEILAAGRRPRQILLKDGEDPTRAQRWKNALYDAAYKQWNPRHPGEEISLSANVINPGDGRCSPAAPAGVSRTGASHPRSAPRVFTSACGRSGKAGPTKDANRSRTGTTTPGSAAAASGPQTPLPRWRAPGRAGGSAWASVSRPIPPPRARACSAARRLPVNPGQGDRRIHGASRRGSSHRKAPCSTGCAAHSAADHPVRPAARAGSWGRKPGAGATAAAPDLHRHPAGRAVGLAAACHARPRQLVGLGHRADRPQPAQAVPAHPGLPRVARQLGLPRGHRPPARLGRGVIPQVRAQVTPGAQAWLQMWAASRLGLLLPGRQRRLLPAEIRAPRLD